LNLALAIAVAVLAVSLLIVVHEAGHAWTARRFGMRVERFSVGFGPVLLTFRRGETEYCLSALPFGGYVRIAGMSPGDEVKPEDAGAYLNHSAWRRFLVILAGPAMNYLAAVVIAAVLLAGPGLAAPDPAARVGDLSPGMPADRAGLRSGDRVLALDDTPVASFADLLRGLQQGQGDTIVFHVERGDGGATERLAIPVHPQLDGGVRRVGFGQATTRLVRPTGAAIAEAFGRTTAQLGDQLAGFGRLFSGPKAGVKLEGPVGIARKLVDAAQKGAPEFFSLVWLISVVLAILNLLPVPALDGGRLVFLGYEIVTRRRPNARLETAVTLAGALALLGLMLGVTVFKDILGR
jgi:regulator of sigma E protease